MPILPTNDPVVSSDASESIALVIDARPRDLGGFEVRRLLPAVRRRRVGPFVFYDHMGPSTFAPGRGIDVRPHPHIALATVTYLFDGEIMHRDSVGSVVPVRPGDVNWMIAGRGIAHSERTGPEVRAAGHRLHGIQSWVALPQEHEEAEPRFEHHPAKSLPVVRQAGAVLDVIAGDAYGARSPVSVLSPTLYVHARLDAGARLGVDGEHAERAVHVVEGAIHCDGRTFVAGTMIVLEPGKNVVVGAGTAGARLMLLGGAPLEGERHLWWNFVSSSLDRIERAKDDWANDRFGKVADEGDERIPLPER